MNVLQFIKNYFKQNKLSFGLLNKSKSIIQKELAIVDISDCLCNSRSCNGNFKKRLQREFIKQGLPTTYHDHIINIIQKQFKCNNLNCCGIGNRGSCELKLLSVQMSGENIEFTFSNSGKYSLNFAGFGETYNVTGNDSTISFNYLDFREAISAEELLVLKYDIEDKVCETASFPVFRDTHYVYPTGAYTYNFEDEFIELFTFASGCPSISRDIIYSYATGVTDVSIDIDNLEIFYTVNVFDNYGVVSLICNGVVIGIFLLTIRED